MFGFTFFAFLLLICSSRYLLRSFEVVFAGYCSNAFYYKSRGVQTFSKEGQIWPCEGARGPAFPSDKWSWPGVSLRVWNRNTPLQRLSCSCSFYAHQAGSGSSKHRCSSDTEALSRLWRAAYNTIRKQSRGLCEMHLGQNVGTSVLEVYFLVFLFITKNFQSSQERVLRFFTSIRCTIHFRKGVVLPRGVASFNAMWHFWMEGQRAFHARSHMFAVRSCCTDDGQTVRTDHIHRPRRSVQAPAK